MGKAWDVDRGVVGLVPPGRRSACVFLLSVGQETGGRAQEMSQTQREEPGEGRCTVSAERAGRTSEPRLGPRIPGPASSPRTRDPERVSGLLELHRSLKCRMEGAHLRIGR